MDLMALRASSLEIPDPIVGTPSITPSVVYNDTAVSCSATVTDPDEPLTADVEWLLNTQSVGTGSTLDLLTTAAMPNDTLSCEASIDDGYGGSDSASTSVIIENRAPVVTSITITPSAPIASVDAVVCEVLGDDPDGETLNVSYDWVEAGGATYSGDTLPSSDISAGEVWTCTGTLSDASSSVSEALDVIIFSPCAFGDCDVAFEAQQWGNCGYELDSAGADSLGRFT